MTDELIGSRVAVHYNLRVGGYAIAAKAGGRILAYVDTVTLSDVRFTVHESTRQRVITRHRRKVHAWAIGTLESVSETSHGPRKLSYNPYRCGSFTVDGSPVDHLERVTFAGTYGWID